jgi:hypothetical protein
MEFHFSLEFIYGSDMFCLFEVITVTGTRILATCTVVDVMYLVAK